MTIDPVLIRGCLGGVKVCNACKVDKPETEFKPYKKRGAYTRWYICMECEQKDWTSRKRLDQKKIAVVRRERQKNFKHIFHRRAQLAVRYAIQTGRLVRPETCERCGCNPPKTRSGASGIEAHHYDYHKPLDVRWLCKKCHAIEHKARLAGEPVPQPPTTPEDLVERLKAYGKPEYEHALLGKGSLDTIIRDLLSDAVEAGMTLESLLSKDPAHDN